MVEKVDKLVIVEGEMVIYSVGRETGLDTVVIFRKLQFYSVVENWTSISPKTLVESETLYFSITSNARKITKITCWHHRPSLIIN